MRCWPFTSPKIFFNLRGGPVDPSVVAAAAERGHVRADRMIAAYLAKMGIDAGLLGLTKTVKFEDIHVLTRDEIARFGLGPARTGRDTLDVRERQAQHPAQDRRCEESGRDLFQADAMARGLF